MSIRGIMLVIVAVGVSFRASGQTWQQTTAPAFNYPCIASSADGTRQLTSGFRVTIPIYLSTNRGEAWDVTTAPVGTWNAIASTPDGTKIAAVDYGGMICISEDGGATWASNSMPHTGWSSVAMSADGARLVAANVAPQTIHISTNGGTVWTPATNAPLSIWQGVASSADGAKLVAVNSYPGTVYISTNGGIDWRQSTNAAIANWTAVASSADGNRLLAVARTGQVSTSADSGITWIANSLPASDWAACAASADGSKLIIASRDGLIYTSVDSGSVWNSNAAPALNWNGVASAADGSRLFAAASGNGVWRLETTRAPHLQVTATVSTVNLAWVLPSIPFVLQNNPDCSPDGWEDVTNVPTLNLSNLHYEISLPLSDKGYYRLRSQ
jgi:hypothetical protein